MSVYPTSVDEPTTVGISPAERARAAARAFKQEAERKADKDKRAAEAAAQASLDAQMKPIREIRANIEKLVDEKLQPRIDAAASNGQSFVEVYLERVFSSVAEAYAFAIYATPILESRGFGVFTNRVSYEGHDRDGYYNIIELVLKVTWK